MNHIKSHIELDNDEIVDYVNSILIELDDIETISYEIIFFNHKGSGVYFVTNNIGTYGDGKNGIGYDRDLPIDRVDLLVNQKSSKNLFNYSDVSDVVNHINSYLWDRGFGQDPKRSSYTPEGFRGNLKYIPLESIRGCLLIDFDGVRNLKRMNVSFTKKDI